MTWCCSAMTVSVTCCAEYFEAVPGIPSMPPRMNTATWMVEVVARSFAHQANASGDGHSSNGSAESKEDVHASHSTDLFAWFQTSTAATALTDNIQRVITVRGDCIIVYCECLEYVIVPVACAVFSRVFSRLSQSSVVPGDCLRVIVQTLIFRLRFPRADAISFVTRSVPLFSPFCVHGRPALSSMWYQCVLRTRGSYCT
jgi:hypothetical protein